MKTIIISNRLPVTVKKAGDHFEFVESIGGLSTGLKGYQRKVGCIWIGWPGVADEDLDPGDKKIIREELAEKYQCIPVFLSKRDIKRYYFGFCNKTIWPLFHYFTSMAEYNTAEWEAYKQVNEKFYRAVRAHLDKDDMVWVHDYQLMLLPGLLKDNFPDTRIGFFLHIPFPSFEIFRLLIWRTELLRGILGADLIGFHTYSYVRHFLSSVRNLFYTDDNLNRISFEGRQIRVDAFPMGIDYDYFSDTPAADADDEKIDAADFKNTKIILSVDRLDYTKGIPERILAFKLFLSKYPEYLGKVRWYLILAPSRAEIDTYGSLLEKIKESVSEINGKYGTLNWMPVWFFYRSFPQDKLIRFYRHSDVLLVTPLRDGMNLVAKEYIACRADYGGMLVISETAGAASQLVEAVIVNPNDLNAIADGIKTALEMPEEDKIARNKRMRGRIERYNVQFWAEDFLNTLSNIREPTAVVREIVPGKNSRRIEKAYASAKKRVLLLDYDGTLVGIKSLPEQAKPDDDLKNLLRQLAADPANTVCIISGRDRQTMARWLGDIENLYFIASHGLWFKSPEQDNWLLTVEQNSEWKALIRPILELYTDHMPGSHIEEKEYALAFHYRQCTPDVVGMKLSEVKETLRATISSSTLALQEGKKVLEVKDSRVNKGQTASMLIKRGDYDFILGVGDDYTDEDLFSLLPKPAFSVKVGSEKTGAGYRIESWKQMRRLLKNLLAAGSGS